MENREVRHDQAQPWRWIDKLERFITNFTASIMLFMALVVTLQVVARYCFRHSPFWTEEIATNLMMWIGLLGAAGAVWTDSHMDLKMIVNRLPQAVQLWVRVLGDFLIVYFALHLTIYGGQLTLNLMNGTLSSLPIAVGYTYMVVPISGVLIIFFALVKALSRILTFYKFGDRGVAHHV